MSSDYERNKERGVEQKIRRKIISGKVVSDKMDKTIVVAMSRRKLHTLYKKYVTATKKIKAHDEKNECHVGDLVRVVESRPLSKDKRWRLLEIVKRAE
jgi:small subunit ribosomal protein S17